MSKVVLISDKLPPDFGGMESHGYEFIRYFSQNKKWKLSSALTFKPEEVPDSLSIAQTTDSALMNNYVKPTLTFESTKNIGELIRELATENIQSEDIIFFNSMWWIRVFDQLKKELPDVKLYFRSGGNDILQSNIVGKGNTLNERRKYAVEQINNYVDTLVVNSEYSLNAFKKLGIKNEIMLKLTGGVDVSRFQPVADKRNMKKSLGVSADVPLIIGTGRLVPFKGFYSAIEALATLNNLPFQYLIVGDGPEKDSIQQAITKNHLENKVHMYGGANFLDIHNLYQAADIYFHFPIKWIREVQGGNYVHTETMGRSFIESSACGIPSLGSLVGGVPEVVQHGKTGYLAKEKNIQQVAKYLTELIEDKDLRIKMGTDARINAISHFSWDVLFEAYMQNDTRRTK